MNFCSKIKETYERFLANSHTQTSIACFWMLLGSFLPILVDSAIKSWAFSMDYSYAFLRNLEGGEVFILTTAMITPFFFLLLRKIAGTVKEKFNFFSIVFLFSLISLVGGVLSFSYSRIGEIINSEEVVLSSGAKKYLVDIFSHDLSSWGVFIYFASLIVWYYAAYHDNNNGKSYEEAVTSSQKDLNKKVFGK